MTDQPSPKSPRWMKLLLIVSLTLNFLIAGIVAGVALRAAPVIKEARSGGPGGAGFAPMVAALEPEHRRDIGRNMRKELSMTPRQGRQDMRRLLVIVRQEPFDRGAAWAIIEMHGKVTTERLTKGQKLLIDKLEAMSPEERAAYAERLDEVLSRKRGSRKGPKDGSHKPK
ncbi:MAG: periplasmic heavy metal sensor [Pseudomonadota bacterium]